ncbi:MAG: HWE histidine kinase domain-containing protein [Methyloceanibacter sp.]
MNSVAYDGSVQPAPGSRVFQRALQSWDGLMEWLPVGIYTCDIDGYVTYYNRSAAELWGHVPELGQESYRFCGSHKAYSAKGAPLDPAASPMVRVLSTGEPVRDFELIIERPDGRRLVLLANLDPLFDDDGSLAGGVSCFQDITARKVAERGLQQREQWYRALLEALPAAIYTTDAAGRVTFFNGAAAELAGRDPTLGEEWCITLKLYKSDGTPIAHSECPMAIALKTGEPVRGEEQVAERPDGGRVPILPYPTPLRDADGIMVGAVNMLVDISERKEAEAQRTLLLRELAHRVNNTFAVILAITQQSLRSASSPEAFAETFSGRLQALAQAHNLLLRGDWRGAEVEDLARGQLEPFCLTPAERLEIAGPELMLAPGQAIALSIVLHELGTNAYKYGALSDERGKIALSWARLADRVRLSWVERDGPLVTPPSRCGIGSRLIQRGLPNASVDWRFEPDGVVCTIDLPFEATTARA